MTEHKLSITELIETLQGMEPQRGTSVYHR